jgi:hypothetical protein
MERATKVILYEKPIGAVFHLLFRSFLPSLVGLA